MTADVTDVIIVVTEESVIMIEVEIEIDTREIVVIRKIVSVEETLKTVLQMKAESRTRKTREWTKATVQWIINQEVLSTRTRIKITRKHQSEMHKTQSKAKTMKMAFKTRRTFQNQLTNLVMLSRMEMWSELKSEIKKCVNV